MHRLIANSTGWTAPYNLVAKSNYLLTNYAYKLFSAQCISFTLCTQIERVFIDQTHFTIACNVRKQRTISIHEEHENLRLNWTTSAPSDGVRWVAVTFSNYYSASTAVGGLQTTFSIVLLLDDTWYNAIERNRIYFTRYIW